MQDVFSASTRKQGVKPLKDLVESRMEEKKQTKPNKMWPAQGLQERKSPASTAWDETPMPSASKYSTFRDCILNIP